MHRFNQAHDVDLVRVKRLSVGLFIEGLSQNRTIEFETVEPVVDVLHYQGDSCYCLIQHPEKKDHFHFFCWSLSGPEMGVSLPKAYLARDILLRAESPTPT